MVFGRVVAILLLTYSGFFASADTAREESGTDVPPWIVAAVAIGGGVWGVEFLMSRRRQRRDRDEGSD